MCRVSHEAATPDCLIRRSGLVGGAEKHSVNRTGVYAGGAAACVRAELVGEWGNASQN